MEMINQQRQQLLTIGLDKTGKTHWNYSTEELVAETLRLGQGTLTSTGALAINTGKFTGRSPKDKFCVKDDETANSLWWGDINFPFKSTDFDSLYQKMIQYLSNKELYIRDAYACADERYRLKIRAITESPWANLFVKHLFLRPSATDLLHFVPEWHILQAPNFQANPAIDGTRQTNFTIINFTKKIILIGGTAYTGEIKKSMFTVLNYILPHYHKVLPMHCSANIGKAGDVCIFFGLSGTGKTTLSADPNRQLIGDDEHGWSDTTIFNFEGGCYAKCVDLSAEKEPQIFNAVRAGALVENTEYFPHTNLVDYANITKTENTRVAYPIDYIHNVKVPSLGALPQHIFFLTADASGVLPPISRLSKAQAMYHFISGYTAKIAGTEIGVTEPQLTFSACFGKAFLPLHPAQYAALLGEKLLQHNVNVWLLNTGWTGGSYGIGQRIKLSYTRALITAVLNGELNKVSYETLPVFHLSIPTSCEGIPSELLHPRRTWEDKKAYDQKAQELAKAFIKNFEQYANGVDAETLAAQPTTG